MIEAGQLWEHRETRRPGRHRVLWVSPDGQHPRIIRCGGWPGRFITADRLRRSYRLARRAPVKAAPRPVERAA